MTLLPFAVVIVLGFYSTGSSAADADKDVTGSSTANSTANAAVVETDHGQGLGPNGADLHIDKNAANEDMEILQKSLQNLPELELHNPPEPKLPKLNIAPLIPQDSKNNHSTRETVPQKPTGDRNK